MPVHSAIFRQPGPELNPIGARVPTPIHVEVFEIESRHTEHSGLWTARETTTKTVFDRRYVGQQSSPYQARYRVAHLFTKQTGPWIVDGHEEPTASDYHLHLDIAEPSLCGSRFHTTIGNTLALSLPDIRAGRRVLIPIESDHLCLNCLALIDRTPAPGDKIRVKGNAQLATIKSLQKAPAGAKVKVPWYAIHYEIGDTPNTTSALPATEFSLVMFEKGWPL